MRNAIIAVIAMLVVGGGLYLAQEDSRKAMAAQAPVPKAETAHSETTQAQPPVPKGEDMTALEYLSDTPKQSFSKAEQVLQEGKDYYAELETSKGKILIDLFEKDTPATVNSFVFLALNRYYEGIVFHRVIPRFMAQTGDPTGTGTGGPGYQFGLEVKPSLNYDAPGMLGMARTQDPNSNGSQFFITFEPTPFLNQQYTIFGKVVEGLDVLNKIAFTQDVPNAARGDARDKILSVKILVK